MLVSTHPEESWQILWRNFTEAGPETSADDVEILDRQSHEADLHRRINDQPHT